MWLFVYGYAFQLVMYTTSSGLNLTKDYKLCMSTLWNVNKTKRQDKEL